MADAELEEILTDFDLWAMNHGMEWAEERLRSRHVDIADDVLSVYRERIGEPIHSGLMAEDHVDWYLPKPDHEMPRWSYAKKRLGLSDDVVAKTSTVADEILARLAPPYAEDITTRGLVVGHVQSGKTTSFLSVAAKAADVGYSLVIILAGVHNSLRRQTQDRSARTLVHKDELWWLGTAIGDFKPDGNSLSTHLAGGGKRGLLVVKKHQTILRRLADWLEGESDSQLRRLKVLVIDDEADQAGLDVGTGNVLSGIHEQLLRIVNLRTSDGMRRCAYLAYTATPYANILTSQAEHGLYPRTFIYPLDKPDNYVGSEELFGNTQIGQPVVLEDDSGDDPMTDGLRDAVRWFVVATAARAALGSGPESFHSSMLIHTTQDTGYQVGLRPAVEDFLRGLADEFEHDESTMADFYEVELLRVPARRGGNEGMLDEEIATWDAVRVHVLAVLRRLIDQEPAADEFVEDGKLQQAHSGVIVDNCKVDWKDRLTYSDSDIGQPGVTVIAIGGNTLSRGLTLEGLVCSYFARTSKTYDSLMQMGRWFGYRPGYRHLVRIWTTQDLLDWFRELNTVEQALRDELAWMEEHRFTPAQYGPRILTSPNMNITRAAAMKSVSKHVSYSDHLIDPGWLDLDSAVLENNQRLAGVLAGQVGESYRDVGSSRLFTGVPYRRIRQFLDGYRFHREDKRIDKASLLRYLSAEVDEGRLGEWNVIFKSITGGLSTYDYGGRVGEVTCIRRARLDQSSIACIGSLVDSGDHRLDQNGKEPEGAARYRSREEPPVMVLYAIDAESPPLRDGNRTALNASTSPIGVSLALPHSESSVEYVSPVLEPTAESDLGDFADV